MTKQNLIDELQARCQSGYAVNVAHYRPGIAKSDIESVLHHLGNVIMECAVLKADKITLPNLGTFHAEWHEDHNGKYLYARFDWSQDVKRRIKEAHL